MLVSFETRGYPTITFFGDIAVVLLRLMGMTGNVPGAIVADDVPGVLSRLKAQLAVEEPSAARTQAQENDKQDEPRVDLSTRAYPLVELLSAAAANGDDVMWRKV